MTYWEKHWETEAAAQEHAPDTWSDAVTRHAFAYWDHVFDRHAPGRRLLECGCGVARLSRHMAERGYECTLMDSSPWGLRRGNEAFQRASLKAASFLGDMQQLPVTSEQFDVVYSGGVIEFLTHPQTAIKEMVRVLEPGGLFAANIIPYKLSCQTLANCQRTLVHSLKHAAALRFSSAFKLARFFPADAVPSAAGLAEYRRHCETAGLRILKATGTAPFPYLSLPVGGQRAYARTMKCLEPLWRRFDDSDARWTELWGLSYTIYGIKVQKDPQ